MLYNTEALSLHFTWQSHTWDDECLQMSSLIVTPGGLELTEICIGQFVSDINDKQGANGPYAVWLLTN